MAFDPVNTMADQPAIISVHDDIADLKMVRLLELELIADLERWDHTLGTHDRSQDFPQR